MKLRDIRRHPKFWDVVALIPAVILFTILFQFYTGFSTIDLITGTRPVDQTVYSVDSVAGLNAPPILQTAKGVAPLNATYNISVNGLLTVVMWVVQFSNNSAHPLPIYEPAYLYWRSGIVPLTFTLSAVYLRFHFYSRLIYNGWTIVNGTRIVISYSNPPYYVPTVKTGTLSSLLKPTNATDILSYPTFLDPSIPYSSLPLSNPRYTPDPWVVLNSPETVQNGILFGALGSVPLGLFDLILISVTIHPEAGKRKARLGKLAKAGVI